MLRQIKILQFEFDWLTHSKITFTWYDSNNRPICSYSLEFYDENNVNLCDFYVQPEFRKKGWAHVMMKHALQKIADSKKKAFLLISKTNFIRQMYESYGWIYHVEYDEHYEWLKLIRK